MPEFQPRADVPRDFDDFTRGYLHAAEWVGIDDENDRPIYDSALFVEWAVRSLRKAFDDCKSFQEVNAALLAKAYQDDLVYTVGRAGHDFWLTRNRHGVGFWDRGLGEVGADLTKAAHRFGEAAVSVRRKRVVEEFDRQTVELLLY